MLSLEIRRLLLQIVANSNRQSHSYREYEDWRIRFIDQPPVIFHLIAWHPREYTCQCDITLGSGREVFLCDVDRDRSDVNWNSDFSRCIHMLKRIILKYLVRFRLLRRPHGDRTIHEIKIRKVTARKPGGDRTATSRLLQLLQVCRMAAVRASWGRREAAVRFSRHPKQGKNRMPPHGHRKTTVRPPYADLAVWLRHCCFWRKV